MSTLDRQCAARLELALSAAREAGRGTLDFFRQHDLQVDRKQDQSPVTIADRRAEQWLRQTIQENFPQDGILGEEFGEQPGTSGFRWILDPIDGTKSFISGVPLYGTMVGVEHEQRCVIGVVDAPAVNECVYAAVGQGAWYIEGQAAPRPARVADTRSLANGLFVTSQVSSFSERGAMQAYLDLEATASITRTWGDCYGYLLVATGRAVAMIDPIMNVWDAAPLQPILEEAGGAFTDWSGQATIYGNEGIGCNPHVLDEILEITRRFVRASR